MATGRPNGRPPKPLEVKKAEGNLGKRKLPEGLTNLGQTLTEAPTPPPGLSKASKDLWVSLWEAQKHLQNADTVIMTMFITAWEDFLFYLREIKAGDAAVKKGNRTASRRVYENANGTIQTHPYFTQLKETRVQLNTYLSSMGLTPADRARLMFDAEAAAEAEAANSMFSRVSIEVTAPGVGE